MVSRMLDLVVLVAEFNQRNDKSFKELGKELEHQGYSPAEIEQALFWISSKLKAPEPGSELYALGGSRVLSSWESSALSNEAHGYLLRLLSLGVLDIGLFERILARVHPFGADKAHLADIKDLVGAAIFDVGPIEFEEEPLNLIDEEPPRT